jgi:hypothetical protein
VDKVYKVVTRIGDRELRFRTFDSFRTACAYAESVLAYSADAKTGYDVDIYRSVLRWEKIN